MDRTLYRKKLKNKLKIHSRFSHWIYVCFIFFMLFIHIIETLVFEFYSNVIDFV